MKFELTSGRRLAAAVFVSAALLSPLAGCGDGAKKAEAEKPAADAVAIFETAATSKQLVEPVIGTGTIAAAKATTLGPRVTGIIDKIDVYVGARVKEGDALFHTRDVEIRLRVAELENQVRLARAEVEKHRPRLWARQ